MLGRLRMVRPGTPREATRLFTRSLVYLKNGETKVRGLKKDESQYLTSPTGVNYPGTGETLEPVKKFLGSKYELPERLLLQSITHKSFAHGKKPYNERLAILGQQLVRMQTSRAAAESGSAAEHAVNGQNFDINQRAVDLLSSSLTVSQVCTLAGLDQAVFWKPAGKGGESTIYSSCVHALVGAILLEHGAGKALEFIGERLLSGPYSVFAISDKVFVNKV